MINSEYWEVIQRLHIIIDKLSITFDSTEQKKLKEVIESLSKKTLDRITIG